MCVRVVFCVDRCSLCAVGCACLLLVVVRVLVFVVRCSFVVVCCSLCVVSCSSCGVCGSLSLRVVRCWLFLVCSMLLFCLLFVVAYWCLFVGASCSLFSVRCFCYV